MSDSYTLSFENSHQYPLTRVRSFSQDASNNFLFPPLACPYYYSSIKTSLPDPGVLPPCPYYDSATPTSSEPSATPAVLPVLPPTAPALPSPQLTPMPFPLPSSSAFAVVDKSNGVPHKSPSLPAISPKYMSPSQVLAILLLNIFNDGL